MCHGIRILNPQPGVCGKYPFGRHKFLTEAVALFPSTLLAGTAVFVKKISVGLALLEVMVFQLLASATNLPADDPI